MARRQKLTRGQKLVFAGATLAFAAFVAWLLGGSALRQRDLALSRATTARVEGPPCPQLTAAEFQARGYRPAKATNYENVVFARQVGHMACDALRYGSGFGRETYPVCQFTGPVALRVRTSEGEWYFAPGPGRPATVAVPHGRASCVLDSNFTIGEALAR